MKRIVRSHPTLLQVSKSHPLFLEVDASVALVNIRAYMAKIVRCCHGVGRLLIASPYLGNLEEHCRKGYNHGGYRCHGIAQVRMPRIPIRKDDISSK